MKISFRQRAAQGFTLIELLIVVIIIAILAAIAIPQFSNSTADAQEASLDANLATVRSALELYRVQHAYSYPSVKASTGETTGCPAPATVGAGAANSAQAFTEQLTMYSNAAGQTCSVGNASYTFGPYMRSMPVEPIKNSAVVTVIAGAMTAAPVDGTGWRFSNTGGQFTINNITNDRTGKPLSSH